MASLKFSRYSKANTILYASSILSRTMPSPGRNWTESEILQAIGLYVRLPFGRLHSGNPEIVELARRIDRTPNSVALKLTNLAAIDESLDRKGMSHASVLDRETWRRFFASISDQARALPENIDFAAPATDGLGESAQAEFVDQHIIGEDLPRLTTARHGQQFFRDMVLASYSSRCAITGIRQLELLVAGHILPWSEDKDNRLNPRNGICLNRLHDRAFEDGLIAIGDDGEILYSVKLDAPTRQKMERMNDTGRFRFPDRFKPNPEFLRIHRDSRFVG